jgi:menaquinone-specific isochorismate synthase
LQLPEFAFVQTAPGRLLVGWGPFRNLPIRDAGRPAFFVSDFFLDDPHPWRHPARWEQMSVEDFALSFASAEPPRVEWRSPELSEFEPLFRSAREAMDRGDFVKVVPVVFEQGRLFSQGEPWRHFAARLRAMPATLAVYGYSYRNHGMIGATPEMLFRAESGRYQTIALAGTRPLDRAEELLSDAKELREHRIVVEDIIRRLAPFGNVDVAPLEILRLPSIAHLATRITFEERGAERLSFSEMTRRLHPTAALGVSPRTEAGERWLREADRGVRRGTFGAPFGYELRDGTGTLLVAIRNLQWSGGEVRVGAGAGLITESRLEREFEELREKRDQVKSLFGVVSRQPAIQER